MMSLQVSLACAILITFIIGNVSSLRCWTCSSDLQMDCDDHFNTSFIMEQQMRKQHLPPGFDRQQHFQLPFSKVCEDYLGRLTHERPVCIKVVRSIPGGGRRVTRECRSLPFGQQIGRCHEPTQRGESVEFCEYCDRDECNSAPDLRTNIIFASVLPLLLFVFSSL